MKRIDKEFFIDRYGKSHKFVCDVDDMKDFYDNLDEDDIDEDDDEDGRYIDEILSIHYEIAHKLYPDSRNPDDVLMNLGWILMGNDVWVNIRDRGENFIVIELNYRYDKDSLKKKSVSDLILAFFDFAEVNI